MKQLQTHRREHDPSEIQCASLLSIKTGGCAEDCAYCPQSAHYQTEVGSEPLMSVDAVTQAAKNAKSGGADRFCLGAAWREVNDGPEFDQCPENGRENKISWARNMCNARNAETRAGY